LHGGYLDSISGTLLSRDFLDLPDYKRFGRRQLKLDLAGCFGCLDFSNLDSLLSAGHACY
jgi:hypothetical protein